MTIFLSTDMLIVFGGLFPGVAISSILHDATEASILKVKLDDVTSY